MRKLVIALAPLLVLGLGIAGPGCADDPDEPNAFQTMGMNDEVGDESGPLPDMAETGDNSADTGDGDGDTTTTDTTGDGDGDTTTTTGDGDGDTTTTDTGPAECGNGIIDDGEQCDGANLGGFTCVDLGYAGGTLACDPVTCTYDASGCMAGTTSTGGTTG